MQKCKKPGTRSTEVSVGVTRPRIHGKKPSLVEYLKFLIIPSIERKQSEHVSCEFDKFRVDTHLCKRRDTPADRLSYGCCQAEHQLQSL